MPTPAGPSPNRGSTIASTPSLLYLKSRRAFRGPRSAWGIGLVGAITCSVATWMVSQLRTKDAERS
jgi:hypothetical protein